MPEEGVRIIRRCGCVRGLPIIANLGCSADLGTLTTEALQERLKALCSADFDEMDYEEGFTAWIGEMDAIRAEISRRESRGNTSP